MVKDVKFAAVLTAKAGAVCREGLPGCEEKATVHVCFEDGSGDAVCKNCFVARLNRGDWSTDTTEVPLAS
jgi:GH24 family phage-related lysozyme (muramidase)